MADYYPLLARAISALPDSTPDSRQVIYERARKALLGQLRRVTPAVPEEDIQRESDALDAATAKLEAEIAAGLTPAPAAPKPASPPPAAPPPPAPADAAPPPPAAPAPRPSFPSQIAKPLTPAPAPSPAPAPQAPSPTVAPPAPATSAPAPAPPLAPRPAAPAPSRSEPQAPVANRPGLSTSIARERIWPPPSRTTTEPSVAAPPVPPPAQPTGAPSPSAAPPVVAKAPDLPPPSARPTLPILEPDTKSSARAEPEVLAVPAPPAEPVGGAAPVKGGGPLSKIRLFGRSKTKTETFGAVLDDLAAPLPPAPPPPPPVPDLYASDSLRPIAPQAPVQRSSNVRYWVFAAILLIVVGGIATLAFRLRDNPEDFARVTRPNPGADTAESSSGKIVERIGAGPSSAPSTPRPATTQPAQPRPQTAQPAAPQQQAAPAPQTPIIPIAHRAALLIEAPDDPQKVKTFVGTVLWRIDRPTGAPPSLVADLEMPEAKFKASIRISKNTDPRLPASHTIDLRFTPEPGGVIADVKDIDVLQMRAEDRPSGEPLSGIPAPITVNYFLFGLGSSETAQARNVELIRNRGWFDLPMLLVTGKIAKITFEKGTTGERMFNEVMAAWRAS